MKAANRRNTNGTPVALGFKTHSGWAAVVAVSASRGSVDVVERRRIELADPSIPDSLQPYHAAEGMDLKRAQAYITRCINRTRELAHLALKTLIDDLDQDGRTAVGCGLVMASGKPLPGLGTILASHALIHTAEGELYREAILHASNLLKLPVTATKERELTRQTAAKLGLSEEGLEQRIAEIGRKIGAPWRQDQKFATLAALLALGG